MKITPYHIIHLCLATLIFFELNAQHSDFKVEEKLAFFLVNSDTSVSSNEVENLQHKFQKFITLQHKKKASFRSEIRFLKHLNYDIHRQFLKKYQHFSSFSQVFKTGNYDCLSGVTFYGLVLDMLKIDYAIYQTNVHIYLVIKTKKRAVLIETTDPDHGFVSNVQYIHKRRKSYDKKIKELDKKGVMYMPRCPIHQVVGFQELIALHYYNRAVKYYNQRNLEKSLLFLRKAKKTYASQRTAQFYKLIHNDFVADCSDR